MNCLRNKPHEVLAQTVSDNEQSFICVGYNDPDSRTVEQDIFCHCWKNSMVDDCSNWDKRDLIDTVAVITTALSVDANIEVNND